MYLLAVVQVLRKLRWETVFIFLALLLEEGRKEANQREKGVLLYYLCLCLSWNLSCRCEGQKESFAKTVDPWGQRSARKSIAGAHNRVPPWQKIAFPP